MKTPNVKFRVLIIGRANAGKTSILQRVCDTMESPQIYRKVGRGEPEQVQLDPTMERGEHNITDELTFTKHDGYIFHDSRGIESGSEEELKVVQKFVREKSTEKRLSGRLHAIWYCIPMDNQRPSLDLKYFNDVCPDKNVPVIAVFTKYDQFKDNIEIRLKRDGCTDWETGASAKAEQVFQEEYVGKLGGTPHFVRLESMHEAGNRCTELLETTANALNDDVVTVMFLAVQRGNLELSVDVAVKRASKVFRSGEKDRRQIILNCLTAFPYLWGFERDKDKDLWRSEWLKKEKWDDRDVQEDLWEREDSDFFKPIQKLLKLFMSFVKVVKFSPYHHDAHHIMIAIILILEHATLLYSSGITRHSALNQAQSHYIQSVHTHVVAQFPAAFEHYSGSEFIQFISNRCLLLQNVPL